MKFIFKLSLVALVSLLLAQFTAASEIADEPEFK